MAPASFLDCGLPQRSGAAIFPCGTGDHRSLNGARPSVIVSLARNFGGYALVRVRRAELREATAALSLRFGLLGAWGGIELFRRRGIEVDLIAGSVTDSQMGQDFIESEFNVPAGNARRDGARLFEIVQSKLPARV